MKSRNARIRAEIRAEAIEWLITFSEREVDAAGRRRFNEWLRASPEHVAMYLSIAALWQDADRIEPKQRRDVERLVSEASTESNVYSLVPSVPHNDGDRPLRPLSRHGLAATALLLVLATLAVVWNTTFRTP